MVLSQHHHTNGHMLSTCLLCHVVHADNAFGVSAAHKRISNARRVQACQYQEVLVFKRDKQLVEQVLVQTSLPNLVAECVACMQLSRIVLDCLHTSRHHFQQAKPHVSMRNAV